MAGSKMIFDESFEKFEGKPTYPPAEFPLNRDDSDARCVHAHNTMGMVGEFIFRGDAKLLAVMAMNRANEPGLYTTFDAEECRAQARAFTEMADYIEKENAKAPSALSVGAVLRNKQKSTEPVSSFKDMIEKMGGQSINLDDYMEPDPNEKNQVIWTLSQWAHKHGISYDSLGFIPQFLHTDDERSAKDQIDANYQHGGGWHEANADGHWKFVGEKLQGDPEDRPYNLVASCKVGADDVLLFDCAWCAIVHPDGPMSVARLD